MKKFELIISLLFLCVYMNAQTKITFEDNTLNGSAIVYGGNVSVIANPAKTGINASSYCLDIVNDGFAPVKFPTFAIPTGTAASYPYAKIKFKIAYKAYNGGSDLDYPQIDLYSSAENPLLDATEKLGTISSAWGSHTSDSLVWKSAEFTFSTSALSAIPNGTLILKLAKSKCEYLIDDIEVIPSPTYNPNMLTLENFENKVIGDATSYPLYKYWSTTSTVGTATIAADPLSSSGNTLKITPTDYNGVINLNVTLPTGKTLDMYDRLYFDLYYNNANGLYAQPYVYADATVIYQVTSGYPSQGSNTIWNTKDYELTGMPTTSNFVLKIGYTSNNSIAYYFDNIKLHLKESTTNLEYAQNHLPLFISQNGNVYKLNMTVDRIVLTDMNGRRTLQLTHTDHINGSALQKGIYILKAFKGESQYTTKIIK
ncbi:MAG: T9SS type A sorting domain-containing protein [Paludibacter sp.]